MMKGKFINFLQVCVLLILSAACKRSDGNRHLNNGDISKVVAQMTEVMVHDVTSPPLAARFYAYTCLAGYEVISQTDSTVKSMYGLLRDYPKIEKPEIENGYNATLTAVFAMYAVAERLQPSGFLLKTNRENFIDSCVKKGFDKNEINLSIAYAGSVSEQILAYAKSDGYKNISNLPRYKTTDTPGNWQLTPPAYILPVEPYFQTIRKLTLDSAGQFNPPTPAPYSLDRSSKFFKFLNANFKKGKTDLTQNEQNIANFWDCNPFSVQNEGHMMIGLKKISPGAHWMGITGIVCKKADKKFAETMKIFTVQSVTLLDAFISCWDAKYLTNRIRPETAIRAILDPTWKPFLQTPPFPEYTSGHSVISASSATILTFYFGDKFSYTDDVEIKFGIPPATFRSFRQAADQAAISRFYGGIHFMDSIENGVTEGNKVGDWVIERVAKKI